MISERYTVHSSERIKSPTRNAKIDAIYYVFDKSLRKTLSQEFSSRFSFPNYGGKEDGVWWVFFERM